MRDIMERISDDFDVLVADYLDRDLFDASATIDFLNAVDDLELREKQREIDVQNHIREIERAQRHAYDAWKRQPI